MNKTLANSMMMIALIPGLITARLEAQSSDHRFVPFQEFLEHTRSMKPRAEQRSAEEMRRYILARYDGLNVTHSFMLGSSHFDCVPALQQPAARELGLDQTAEEPPASLLAQPTTGNDPSAEGPAQSAGLSTRQRNADEFGNSVHCEEGTIPVRRLTSEDLSQFSSLREFFRKSPEAPAADLSNHMYSRMYQSVNNLGGNTTINIWSPYVDTAQGQEFTLAQAWYLGGSGNAMQSLEVGWQNYPGFYGDQNARLFIYWTADDYKTTGCYNLDCAAFVQTNSDVVLGGDFGSNYSSLGGTQYDFSAEYILYSGNWWLAIDGAWVGYYPASIYRGGQLSKYAEQIQFGTESLGSSTWPGEGSAQWSTSGWARAAYQRNLYHFDTNNKPVWNSLTQWNSSPKCYSVSGPFTSNSSGWGVFFYEGGPGGAACR